jgi:acetylornithine deacetylase
MDIGDRVVRDDVIALERELVRIPSYTTEEASLARRIHAYMREIGLQAQLQPVPLSEGRESFNVVGTIPGSDHEPLLLLIGHMDHAPALGRAYDDLGLWKRDPFAGIVEGDWLYGKGAQDEKGGLCAMLIAAKAVLEAGFQPAGAVYFVAVQGHKRVSSGVRHLLASGLRTTYAINTENSGNAIVPRWVGRAEGRVHVRARAGGRELHFHFKEVDPTLKTRRTVFEHMAKLLQAFGPEMTPPESTGWMTHVPHDGLPGYPQFRIEKIETHSQMHVAVSFQIRTVPGQTEETLRVDLQRLVEGVRTAGPDAEMELEFPTAPVRPAVDVTDSDPLVRTVASAHEAVTGRPPEISGRGRLGAAADASLLAAANITTILYGPGGGDSDAEHQHAVHDGRIEPDERISIGSIVDAAKVYAIAVMELCGTQSTPSPRVRRGRSRR